MEKELVNELETGFVRLPITQDEIDWAQAEIKKFDQQKTYEKLACNNNWLGLIGELKLHQWLDQHGIYHVWQKFTKQDWDKADFIIANRTVDVKTTFDTKMWVQTPQWHTYILARVNKDLKEIFFVGFITKDDIEYLMQEGVAEVVDRGRKDNTIAVQYLTPFKHFLQSLILTPMREGMTENNMGVCTKCGKACKDPYTMCYQCKFPAQQQAGTPAQTPAQASPMPTNQRDADMKRMNELSNRRTALESAVNWLSTMQAGGALPKEQLNNDEPIRLANKFIDWINQQD